MAAEQDVLKDATSGGGVLLSATSRLALVEQCLTS